jgi:hypothetical protein
MGKRLCFVRLATLPLLIVLALFVLPAAQAQDSPRLEFTGNYSYLRYDSYDLGFKNDTGLNGGNISVAYNITTKFAAFGEVGGNWGNPFRFYDGMGGGRYSYRRGNLTIFGQGMFGRAKSHVDLPTSFVGGETNSAKAFGGGGGVSYEISPHFSVRAIQVDYIHSNLFETNLNNIRFSAGITYHLGKIRSHKHPRLTQ